MKWFKHMSASADDEKISKLEDKAGLEGYGFYWRMLEIIARDMDGTSRCHVTYSATKWGRQANISTKKFLMLLRCCSDVGLMSFCRSGDEYMIKIPNLLKYKDEYTKKVRTNSGQAPVQEGEGEGELEVDKDIHTISLTLDGMNEVRGNFSKETKKNPPLPPTISPDVPFSIFIDWKPSPHLPTLAKSAGLGVIDRAGYIDAVGEFVAYWLTQNRQRTQAEWDHAFVKNLKSIQLRGASNPKPFRQERAGKFDPVAYVNRNRINPERSYENDACQQESNVISINAEPMV